MKPWKARTFSKKSICEVWKQYYPQRKVVQDWRVSMKPSFADNIHIMFRVRSITAIWDGIISQPIRKRSVSDNITIRVYYVRELNRAKKHSIWE